MSKLTLYTRASTIFALPSASSRKLLNYRNDKMKTIASLLLICTSAMFAFVLQQTDDSADSIQKAQPVENASADNLPQEKANALQSNETLKVKYPIEMNYLLSLPENYATGAEAGESFPLVLFLHGAGERGDDLDLVKVHGPPKLVEQGKQFPFILVSPQCAEGRYWEPVSLSALLDDIESKYNVDPKRVYVTGLSMGGFGTWSMAAHSSERFAAIAPVCGGGDRFAVPRLVGDQMGIWVFHGAKDNVVVLERSQELVDAFKDKGIEVKFTIYPEAGHDSWTQTYDNDEFYTWLLSHSRD